MAENPEELAAVRETVEQLNERLFRAGVQKGRDVIIASLTLHENNSPHEGNICWDEREGVVAFIAHALRLDAKRLIGVAEKLRDYELDHARRRAKTPSEVGNDC